MTNKVTRSIFTLIPQPKIVFDMTLTAEEKLLLYEMDEEASTMLRPGQLATGIIPGSCTAVICSC